MTSGTPLSAGQQALWLAHQAHPGNSAYNVIIAVSVGSPLDVPTLEQAVEAVVRQHGQLRTAFTTDVRGFPRQVPAARSPGLEVIDLGQASDEELRHSVARRCAEPFDLDASSGLGRFLLMRSHSADPVLAVVAHHIVTDFPSHGRVVADLLTAYQSLESGEPVGLEPVATPSYPDFVAEERASMARVPQATIDYWRDRATEFTWPVDLAAIRATNPSPGGSTLEVEIPRRMLGRLKARARSLGVGTYPLLLAAFQALIYRHSGEGSFAVVCPTAHPARRRYPRVVGYFVEPIVVGCSIGAEDSLRSLAVGAKDGLAAAARHRGMSLADVARLIGAGPMGLGPANQFAFGYQQADRAGPILDLYAGGAGHGWISFAGLRLAAFDVPQQEGHFALAAEVVESSTGSKVVFRYRTDIYAEHGVRCLAAHFLALLAAAGSAEEPVSRVALARSPERDLIEGWSRGERRIPDGRLAHQLIAEAAGSCPGAAALVTDERTWTYGELDQRAEAVAQALRARRVQPGEFVGVCLGRCAEEVVALLGVHKAGAAFVLIEPKLPRERIAFIVADAGLETVITTRGLVDELRLGARACLFGDVQPLAGPVPEATAEQRRADAPAYLVYTSGSTGLPKGVAPTRHGLANLVHWQRAYFGLGPGDVVLRFASSSFDAAVWEIFLSLGSGAALYIPEPGVVLAGGELARRIESGNVTHVTLPPSVLSGLDPFTMPHLTVVVAGEACPAGLSQAWSTGGRLVNAYGPSETTVCATVYRPTGEAGPVPIGRPAANLRVGVVNGGGEPVAVGEPGELLVTGPAVAPGYLGRPALTERHFTADDSGEWTYRTGDMVCWRPDGQLLFLGRRDAQLKVRGYRVEPGEIEAALEQHPAVGHAVAVARGDAETRALAAFVTGTAAGPELRAWLAERLPDYLVPSTITVMDELPRTLNGKVDRVSLARVRSRLGGESPRTTAEKAIAAIWREALQIEDIGRDEEFFALGGHSLAAVRVTALVLERLGVELDLGVMLDRATVASVAGLVDSLGIGVSPWERFIPAALAPADAFEPFELTEIQQTYLVGRSDELALGGVSAHGYFELSGRPIDVARLEQAWNDVVANCAALRTVVTEDSQQRVLPTVPRYRIVVNDLRGCDEAGAGEGIERIRAEMTHQVLPVHSWPTFDIRCSHLPDGTAAVHLSFDGFFLDATGMRRALKEWEWLYRGNAPTLTVDGFSFRDYVIARARRRGDEREERDRAYWRERLADLPDRPDLPMAADPDRLTSARFTALTRRLSAAHWRAFGANAVQAAVSPSAALLTAYAECLATWARTRLFTLNLTSFQRLPLHTDVDKVIGDFTSLTLLGLDLRADKLFGDRARDVQAQLWTDLDHHGISGIELLRERMRGQHGSSVGAMPVVFTSTLGLGGANTPGWGFESFGELVHASSQTPQVWLDHVVVEVEDGVDLVWNAVLELFPPGMIPAMFESYVTLVERLADPSRWGEAAGDLRPAADKAHQDRANDTARSVPDMVPLHEWFRERASKSPDAIAVIDADAQITYQELARMAEAVAATLANRGVRMGDRVAVSMRRSWRQIAAVLGVCRLGAVYVPVSPELPTARRKTVLSECGSRVTLVDDATAAEELSVSRISAGASIPGDVDVALDAPAYIIYTSGSTGRPKGVTVSHRSAVNTMLDVNRRWGIGAWDRVLAVSDLGFDLSVYDIFGLLAAGGALVLPESGRHADPAHLAELAARHSVTVWNSVPAIMQLVAEHCADGAAPGLEALRVVLLSGDWIPASLPDRIRELCPDAQVISLGGATEAAVWSICGPAVIPDVTWPSVPYGTPLANQTFHVLDERLKPRPAWAIGELYIGGMGLAMQYWADPERTAERFIVHPRTGERLYRTGDLGRYRPSGIIEFLGRSDHQVKINGYRIELGDVEAALGAHPAVADGAVVAPNRDGRRWLAAFVVPQLPAEECLVAGEAPGAMPTAAWRMVAAGLDRPAEDPQSAQALRSFARFERALEAVSTMVIENALAGIGMFGAVGERYGVEDILRRGRFSERYRNLLGGWLLALAEDGLLHRAGEQFECDIPLRERDLRVEWAAAEQAMQGTRSAPPLLDYVRRSAQALLPMLRGDTDPLELLFDDGELRTADAVYRDNDVMRQCNDVLAQAAANLVAASTEPLRVIELGAGTGASSASVLPVLDGHCSEYLFTDVSGYLVGQAGKRFSGYPFVRFGRYDVNLPPGLQGVRTHGYDLVIAANVMHDAPDSQDALRRAAQLLAPGGVLILIEGTGANRMQLVSLGLLEGLSAYQDDRSVTLSALRTAEAWTTQLKAAGFIAAQAWTGGVDHPVRALRQAVIAAQMPHQVQVLDVSAVRRYLGDRLPSYMMPTTVTSLDRIPLTPNGKVDRAALESAAVMPGLDAGDERPSTGTEPASWAEKLVATAWCRALGISAVNREDDYFDVGGDSLSGIRIVSWLREKSGVNLRIQDIFEARTVTALAAIIEDRQGHGHS